MIAETGHYALVLALALALIQSSVPILGARLGDPALMNVARSSALAQLLFVALSFAALVTLHVTSDFSVVNVFENSHSLKPLIYKITGVRNIQATSVHGRTQRAHAASMRPSISAAIANENEIENPT